MNEMTAAAADTANSEFHAAWNVRKALLAAFSWGTFGSVAAALAVLVFACSERWNDPTFAKDLRAGQVWRLEDAIHPMFGCGVIFATAGWVAHAIQPSQRFAYSLAIVASSSVAIYMFVGCTGLIMPRSKLAPPALIYPPAFFLLVLTPLAVGALATYLRWNRSKKS